MHEIELKCQIPSARRDAVRRAVATASARTASARTASARITRLQARYFDTPDRRLAAAGIALRLRLEGDRWVQTLKGRGDGLMQRLEHECLLPSVPSVPSGDAAPALDITRHDGTPAADLLHSALAGAGASALIETFATDIHRTHRRVRAAGSVIELAFDEGEIRAAGARWPVCELEFELIEGVAAAVPRLVAQWVQRHGLWIDPRSKAERGERLARGLTEVPATMAEPPALNPDLHADDAWRRVLGAALGQVLPNAAELADGSGTPEHLHQCRAGLRRLCHALRDWCRLASTETPALAAARALDEPLADLARQLGCQRDADVRAEQWLPRLQAHGVPVPPLFMQGEAGPDVGALLRAPATTAMWLAVIEALHTEQPVPDGAARPWVARVQRRWRRLHRAVVQAADGYAQMSDSERHHVRKHLKRLRDAVEAGSGLVAAKPLRRYLAALHAAQDALGADHDGVVSQAWLAGIPAEARTEAHGIIAGWLAGQPPKDRRAGAAALSALAEAPRPWRHLLPR